MKIRGIRILAFTIPVLVISMIASYRRSPLSVRTIYQSKPYKKKSAEQEVRTPNAHKTVGRLIYNFNLSRRIKKSHSKRFHLSYIVRNANGDTISTGKLMGKIQPPQVNQITLKSNIMVLDPDQSFTIRHRIIGERLPIRSWRFSLIQASSQKNSLILLSLSMLLWPSVSIMALGMFILLFPYLVK